MRKPADATREKGASQPRRAQHEQGAHPVEWTLGALSGVLVLAMIGFVLYQAGGSGPREPDIRIAVERVEAAGETFRVAFRASNHGAGTAAGVRIEGQIKRGDETLEASDVTLDYIPAHSAHRGVLLFRQDPRQHRLQLDAKGYDEP